MSTVVAAGFTVIMVFLLVLIVDERIGLTALVAAASEVLASLRKKVMRKLVPDTGSTDRVDKGFYRCPCGKVMAKSLRDQHLRSHRPEQDPSVAEKEFTPDYTEHNPSVRGELVDDYDVPSVQDEEGDGFELPETGGSRRVERLKLRKFWKPYIKKLREKGVVEVTRNTHHGKLRGNHVARRFRQDLKRMDLDWDVEVELGDPATIRKV